MRGCRSRKNTRHVSTERSIVAWKLAVILGHTCCHVCLPPFVETPLKSHDVVPVNARYWVLKRDGLQRSGKTTRLMVTRSSATGSAKTTAVPTTTTPLVRSSGQRLVVILVSNKGLYRVGMCCTMLIITTYAVQPYAGASEHVHLIIAKTAQLSTSILQGLAGVWTYFGRHNVRVSSESIFDHDLSDNSYAQDYTLCVPRH